MTGVWRVAFLGVAEGGHLSPRPTEPSVSREHLEGPNFPVTMPVNKLTGRVVPGCKSARALVLRVECQEVPLLPGESGEDRVTRDRARPTARRQP